MKLRHYDGSLTMAAVGLGLVVFGLLFVAIWAMMSAAFGADSAAPCLTKEQARAKWPKEWIYWHGMNHCWDNVRGTANTANKADGTVQIINAPKPNRKTKADKSLPIDASGNTTTKRVELTTLGPTVYYPELMGGGGTSSDMLTPYSMQEWPFITDIDKDPPPFLPWQRRILLNTHGE